MELIVKAESCMIAIKPIPIITILTKDSIIDIPFVELDLSIYFNPAIFTFIFFIHFHILKIVQGNFVHMV